MHPQLLPGMRRPLVLECCGPWVQLQVWKLMGRLSLLVNRPTMDGKARKNLVLHQHVKYFAKIRIHLLHGPGANGSVDKIRNHKAPWGFTGREDSSIRLGISGLWETGRR